MTSLRLPQFKEEKAIAVATLFLKLKGGKCDKYWLNKVMYYVERQSLVLSGQPIFFDDLYSLPYGPIVSAVNDGIDSIEYPVKSSWSDHFDLHGKIVSLKIEGDLSLLSPFEEDIITKTYQEFKKMDFTKLHNVFKSLPEHKETQSRVPITHEEILEKEGYDQTAIAETINELNYHSFFEQSVNGGKKAS